MKNLLLFFSFICMATVTKASFDYTPVLVHLSKSSQHDTIGFNLVEEIPQLVYRKILAGEVTLWDTPLKSVKINADALQAIERSTETTMLSSKDLFINELWRQFRKEFEFNIIGFTFMNSSEAGQKVVYGFVDLEEIKELLKSLVIPTNANGPCNLTYWDALYSKAYPFNIVQFGTNTFQGKMGESIELQNELFRNPKMKTNAIPLKQQKEISYFLLPNNAENSVLFSALNKFLNNNKEVYFNLGGNEIHSFYNHSLTINISKIEIIEQRSKNDNLIDSYFKKVILYVDGKPLNELTDEAIQDLPIIIEFKTMKEYLSLLNTKYTITKINHQNIAGAFAAYYQKALTNDSWNQITLSTITE